MYNTAPYAGEGWFDVLHDEPAQDFADGHDMDEDTVSFAIVDMPDHGTLTIDTVTGEFEYVPHSEYVGADTCQFSVSDDVASTTETIHFYVYNNAPVAENGSETALVNEPINGYLSGYDPDLEDLDNLVFSKLTDPASGTLDANADGSFEFVPSEDYVGTLSFDFEVSDGITSAIGTFFLVYQAAPQPTVSVELASTIIGRTSVFSPVPNLEKPGSIEGQNLVFDVMVSLPEGTDELPSAVTVTYQTQDGPQRLAPRPPVTLHPPRERSHSQPVRPEPR